MRDTLLKTQLAFAKTFSDEALGKVLPSVVRYAHLYQTYSYRLADRGQELSRALLFVGHDMVTSEVLEPACHISFVTSSVGLGMCEDIEGLSPDVVQDRALDLIASQQQWPTLGSDCVPGQILGHYGCGEPMSEDMADHIHDHLRASLFFFYDSCVMMKWEDKNKPKPTLAMASDHVAMMAEKYATESVKQAPELLSFEH